MTFLIVDAYGSISYQRLKISHLSVDRKSRATKIIKKELGQCFEYGPLAIVNLNLRSGWPSLAQIALTGDLLVP